MNLQDILSRRERCIICQSELVLYSYKYPNLQYKLTEKGLRISFKPRGKKSGILMFFKYNGDFEREHGKHNIYEEPLELEKKCPSCVGHGFLNSPPLNNKIIKNNVSYNLTTGKIKLITLKSRSLGLTTLVSTTINNIRNLAYSYSFTLLTNEFSYNINLVNEVIRYHNEESFYHLYSDYNENYSTLHHGKYDETLENILTIHIPSSVNLSNINNIDQFIQKYKTLLIFS